MTTLAFILVVVSINCGSVGVGVAVGVGVGVGVTSTLGVGVGSGGSLPITGGPRIMKNPIKQAVRMKSLIFFMPLSPAGAVVGGRT